MSADEFGTTAPSPVGADTVDALTRQLRSLRAWAGISYRELHRRVVRSRRERGVAELPVYNTVYRCLQPGRSRLDAELVVDVARVLLDDDVHTEQWRQACQTVAARQSEAAVVSIADRLPTDPPGFTGRAKELGYLHGEIDTVDDGTAVIAALEGMAGVGKTRLALHAAHTLVRRGRFTDLQLWVDLRGYDPHRPPADPAAVLDGFLRRLGVAGSQLAGMDLTGRSAMFRELMASRRALVVLDNAAGVDQVAPILPAGTATLTLVTSRNRLTGLNRMLPTGTRTKHHVSVLPLDVYTPTDAMDVLRVIIGTDRVAEEPASATRIGELVGHLPLALSLIATRIRAMPDWSLADHADRLAERRTDLRLDDAVAVALRLSCDDVSADHQRLLRLVSLHPGRDFDADVAAALNDTTLNRTSGMLTDLLHRNLLLQRNQDRYELHDLVRDFATDRARDTDPPASRHAALDRLLDYYRYAALRAMHVYAPQERPRAPKVPDPGHAIPTFGTRHEAAAWLGTERANIVASATYAALHDRPEQTTDLAHILFRYLDTAGHHRDNEFLQTLASRVGRGSARGRSLNRLGIVFLAVGQYPEAVSRFREALVIFQNEGDVAGQGAVLTNLGGVQYQLGDYGSARDYFAQATDVARGCGDRVGEGRHLDNLGNTLLQLGRHREALDCLRAALTIVRETADEVAEGHVLANLGEAHHRTGRHETALEYLTESLATCERTGHRLGMADTLNRIGRLTQGETAIGHHREALTIAREDGHRELEVESLNAIGTALHVAGDTTSSADCHQQALTLAEELGMRHQQAHAHDGLAHARLATKDRAGARRHWTIAHHLYTELGVPEADEIAHRLSRLPSPD
ncbi:tetratricopeptide repeat protein [Actinophytocola sp.]|uniref:tetratricopeptide repeat protein n=1 Tax=Actinophytocola sp. TaxID=1872138 RepID=UPI003D6A2463